MAILLSNAEGQSDIVLVTLYCPESTLLLAQAPDQAETPYQLLGAGKAQSTIVIQDYLDRLNLALSNITITAFGSPGTEQCFITAQDRMTPTLRNAMPDSLDTTERWQIHKHTSAPGGGPGQRNCHGRCRATQSDCHPPFDGLPFSNSTSASFQLTGTERDRGGSMLLGVHYTQ